MNKTAITAFLILLASVFINVLYVNTKLKTIEETTINTTPIVVINKMKIFKAKTAEIEKKFTQGKVDVNQAKNMGAQLATEFLNLVTDLQSQGILVIDEKGNPLSIPTKADKTQWFANKMNIDLSFLKDKAAQ